MHYVRTHIHREHGRDRTFDNYLHLNYTLNYFAGKLQWSFFCLITRGRATCVFCRVCSLRLYSFNIRFNAHCRRVEKKNSPDCIGRRKKPRRNALLLFRKFSSVNEIMIHVSVIYVQGRLDRILLHSSKNMNLFFYPISMLRHLCQSVLFHMND